jgi:hypothetical protein
MWNRLRYTRHEVRQADYAIINDVCHHYQTMLYFISIDAQKRQLREAGFAGEVCVYDLAGRPVTGACRDGTLAFTVTRSPETADRRSAQDQHATTGA